MFTSLGTTELPSLSSSGPSVLSAIVFGVFSAIKWLYNLQFSGELLQKISCNFSSYSVVDIMAIAMSATQHRQFNVTS